MFPRARASFIGSTAQRLQWRRNVSNPSNRSSQDECIFNPGSHLDLEQPDRRSKDQGYGYFYATANQSVNNGRYVIERPLGRGAHSSVWSARDMQ